MTDDVQHQLRILENGTREEAWEAAKNLESEARDIVLSLIALLMSAKRADARAAAAYVLGFSRYACARIDLEKVVDNSEEDSYVRGHAAEALAYIEDPRSLDILLRNLHDSSPEVKYWCIFALGQIGDAKAITALTQMAGQVCDEHYKSHSLRMEALDAIAEIKRREGEPAQE